VVGMHIQLTVSFDHFPSQMFGLTSVLPASFGDY